MNISISSILGSLGSLSHNATAGIPAVLSVVAHKFGSEGVVAVSNAIEQARTAPTPVPWLTIFTTLLPYLIQILLGGGTFSLQDIINAVLALITPKTP